jgi:hypothetical protein
LEAFVAIYNWWCFIWLWLSAGVSYGCGCQLVFHMDSNQVSDLFFLFTAVGSFKEICFYMQKILHVHGNG